jgi:glucosamine--fructose-6-phosphate aminotransferase (isomerizing)
MCGIIGKISTSNPITETITKLKILENRGYESWGYALIADNIASIHKTLEDISLHEIREKDFTNNAQSFISLAHTRWSTQGDKNNVLNAHPHQSHDESITVVHNGTITNAPELTQYLTQKGITLKTSVDSEIIPNLITLEKQQDLDTKSAIKQALQKVIGTYSLLIHDTDTPNTIYAAVSNEGALVYNIDTTGITFASEARALDLKLNEQYAQVPAQSIGTFQLGEPVQLEPLSSNASIDLKEHTYAYQEFENSRKGSFNSFFEAELWKQQEIQEALWTNRVQMEAPFISLGGLEEHVQIVKNLKHLYIVACGSSLYAGKLGQQMFQDFSHIPTTITPAYEFLANNYIQNIPPDSGLLLISQSGETQLLKKVLQQTKDNPQLITIGLVNVSDSYIARNTHMGMMLRAQEERSVAATKSFTAQLGSLYLLALYLGERNGSLSSRELHRFLQDHHNLFAQETNHISAVLTAAQASMQKVADTLLKQENRKIIITGLGPTLPIAQEAALKIQEIAYLPVLTFDASEFDHGPIALIDDNTTVISLIPEGPDKAIALNLLKRIQSKSQNTSFHVVGTGLESQDTIGTIHNLPPSNNPYIHALLSLLPMQYLALYLAEIQNLPVDKPRNLAKTVTV